MTKCRSIVRDLSELKDGVRLVEIQDITVPSDKGTPIVVESKKPFYDRSVGQFAIKVRVNPERADGGELRTHYLADHGIGGFGGLCRYCYV